MNAQSMDTRHAPHHLHLQYQAVQGQFDAHVSKDTCSNMIILYYYNFMTLAQPTELCPEGSVRLAGGDIEQEGRVEVCFGGVWGTICRNGWGAGDAYVACRSLGYDPGIGM